MRLAQGLALAVIGVAGLAGALLWRGATGDDEPREALSSSTEARGEALYATYCAACHGIDLRGEANWKSPLPDGSYPAPPHDASGHTWHHGDGLLFRIVKEGGVFYATASTPSRMPGFGDQLCDADLREVIEYLKSQWGPRERAFQAQASVEAPYPTPLTC